MITNSPAGTLVTCGEESCFKLFLLGFVGDLLQADCQAATTRVTNETCDLAHVSTTESISWI